MSNILAIQSSIAGYNGDPVTLLLAFNKDSDVLVVSKQVSYKRELLAVADVAIASDPSIYRDSLFSEKDFSSAISDYFEMANSVSKSGSEKQLQFSDSTRRHDPNSYIEQDGMDASGWKYRMKEMSNGSVAVLAACHYVKKSKAITAAIDYSSTLNDLISGKGVTI
jgi:hypothetical protein